MKKNDLKAGMMVSLRHVAHDFIVMCDCYIHGKYYLKAIVSLKPSQTVYSLAEYDNDLTHKTNPGFDIMKVVWPSKIPFNGVEVGEYKLIWRRPAPVDFLSAVASSRRIRLAVPVTFQTPLNDFQDIDTVLTELSLLTGATRNSLMLSKWVIEPEVIEPEPEPEPEVPSPPVDPVEEGEE
jgi:hypothetical protein